jgi:hypothetical protein
MVVVHVWFALMTVCIKGLSTHHNRRHAEENDAAPAK